MKELARRFIRKIGFDVRRFGPGKMGIDPFEDMVLFLKGAKTPTVFDVGANVGQTVKRFRKIFPHACIHSFEPSPSTYKKLSEQCGRMDGVKTWNCAVGSQIGTLPLLENAHSDMSSFLTLGELGWGKIEKTTEVKVLTLDSFAREHNVDFIHVLKSDTQGYDFEVLKGAEGLMKQGKIGLVYFEFIFSHQYKNLPPFDEVFHFLTEHNFTLVAFYKEYYQEHVVSWVDVMFIQTNYHRQWLTQYNG